MTTVKKKQKEALVRSRMNATRKRHVEAILEKLGMNHSEAINLFYAQIELVKGLPFDVRIPNETTKKVLQDSKEGKNLKVFNTKAELFDDLKL